MSNSPKYSVLIVDDEKANIITLTHILSPQYTIYAAKNGADAIELAREHTPDVILLDILMPDTDGYEVLSLLKNADRTRDIPVVFVTGLSNTEDEEKGLGLGASDYITKPFRPAIVKLRVRNQISAVRHIRTIERLSMTDQLTNLPNRRSFDTRIELEWSRAMREQKPISVLMLDVDHFKKYNDTFGHHQGDVALKTFAETLSSTLKRSTDFVARWGGEEFIALLPNTAPHGAVKVAEEIRARIEAAVIPSPERNVNDKSAAKITVSIGANTSVPGVEANSIAELFSGVDIALYSAKDSGRNKVCHFNDNKSFDIRYSRTATEYEYELMKYKLVGDALNIAMWEMNTVGDNPVAAENEMTWSSRLTDVLGYTELPVITEPFLGWLHPEDRERACNAFCAHILDYTGNTPFNIEYRLRHKDGHYLNFHAFGATLRDNMGNPIRAAGAIMDITEKKRMTEELKRALEQANTASTAKGNFLSNMSHEMRTPINAIVGMTAIGKKSDLMTEKNHALNKIEIASTHLLAIINNVLDMAKIEADKLVLSPIEYNFADMLHEAVTFVSFMVDEKRQILTVDIDDNIPVLITGDSERLSQVIINLVSNAVKFTPDGGMIRLETMLISRNDDGCEIQVSVTDNGIGIDPSEHDKLFRMFEQVDNRISREYGGTGLGLAISARIVRLMGGEIRIESERGKGARFIITVKAGYGQPGSVTAPADNDAVVFDFVGAFAGKRMLLAEDVEINREILVSLLEDTGLQIDCALNGEEAVNMVRDCDYDIIFMDMQMPKMDGLEATVRIREMGYAKPIVAMTANVFKSDIQDCIAVGMNRHIGKPINIGKVLKVLRRYLCDNCTV
jgi:diguanylate cyclase (GGDEF)-like protein/PAS domain S-box-containing protein